jgi:hypothetical protein
MIYIRFLGECICFGDGRWRNLANRRSRLTLAMAVCHHALRPATAGLQPLYGVKSRFCSTTHSQSRSVGRSTQPTQNSSKCLRSGRVMAGCAEA